MCSLDMVLNTFIKNLTSNKLGCYLEGRDLNYHNLTYPNQKWPSLSISTYGFRHLILPLRINIENLTSKSNRRLILSMHVFRTFIFLDLLQQVQKNINSSHRGLDSIFIFMLFYTSSSKSTDSFFFFFFFDLENEESSRRGSSERPWLLQARKSGKGEIGN